MTMHVYQFGTTSLPGAQGSASVPLTARPNTIATLGGHYNPYRGARADVRFPLPVTVSAYVVAASNAALGVALDALRARIGERDRLWADPYDTTQVDRWAWATLTGVPDRPAYADRIWQRIDLGFELESHWNGHAYGGAWYLNAGYLFDNGLYLDSSDYEEITGDSTAFTLANDGNRLVTNLGLTITPEDYTVTNLTFTSQNCQWTWTGALSGADELVIDCGSKTVLLNDADDYGNFALSANHVVPHWLEVAAGGETITVTTTRTGGPGDAPRIVWTYSDGWY